MSAAVRGHKTGYKHPPEASRFQKGRSGNPQGRPRGKGTGIPHEAVLARKVLVRDDGVESHKTAAEAFLLHLTRKGLAGDGTATRAALESIAAARSSGIRMNQGHRISMIVLAGVAPGNPNAAMLPLKMARRYPGQRDTARVLLEPWLVEAALARLGTRQLTPDEQQVIIKATRTPHQIRWPAWWMKVADDDAE